MLVATAKLRIHRKVHLTRPRPQPKRNCPTWKPASTPPSNNASPTLKKFSRKRKLLPKIQPSPPMQLVFFLRTPNSKPHKRRLMNFLLAGQNWKPSLTSDFSLLVHRFLMSLRWRCAPAYGSNEAFLFSRVPSPYPSTRKRVSGTDWAKLCRAFGALCMGSPQEHERLQHHKIHELFVRTAFLFVFLCVLSWLALLGVP